MTIPNHLPHPITPSKLHANKLNLCNSTPTELQPSFSPICYMYPRLHVCVCVCLVSSTGQPILSRPVVCATLLTLWCVPIGTNLINFYMVSTNACCNAWCGMLSESGLGDFSPTPLARCIIVIHLMAYFVLLWSVAQSHAHTPLVCLIK